MDKIPLNQRIDKTKLEKHPSGDGWLVPMRNGGKAWVFTFNKGDGTYPIIGMVGSDVESWTKSGFVIPSENFRQHDLMIDAYVDPYAELKAAHNEGKVIQVKFPNSDWADASGAKTTEWPSIWNLPPERYRVKPEWTLGRSVNGFTLQDGQEWIWPEIWTEENLAGCRPLIVGELEQFGDQFSSLRPPFTEWNTITSGGLEINPENYQRPRRTRRPLPPVKKMVLTFDQIAEGWIEWNGGKCPVAANSKPKYMLRSGAIANDTTAGFLCWHHRGTNSDIVAYLPEVKNMVKLGPEDVKCGDVLSIGSHPHCSWLIVGVETHGIRTYAGFMTWLKLQDYKISRDGGKTWQECQKEEK